MSNLVELTSLEDWETLKKSSSNQPVVLFKHSTTCPISANAWKALDTTLEELQNQGVVTAFVKVIESRPVSLHIAEDIGVGHQSPQVILIKDQEAIWNTSHGNITKQAILEHLS